MIRRPLKNLVVQGLLLVSIIAGILLMNSVTMREPSGRPAVLQAATVVVTPANPTTTPWVAPTPYPYATWLAPAKREELEREDQRLATAVAVSLLTATPIPWAQRSPAPRLVTPAPFVTPLPGGPFHVAGDGMLVDFAVALVPSIEFLGQNAWLVAVPGGIMYVYAGAEGYGAGTDEGWGELLVAMTPEQTRVPLLQGEFPTPTRVGPVHVVGATGMRLQIATLDGSSTFTFDVSARQWVTP